MKDIDAFRRQKDQFFRSHPQSPLRPQQQRNFAGLSYFPVDPGARHVLPVEEFADKQTVAMQTSTGDTREYTRFGRVRFTVEGQPVVLTLFADGEAFFLPFADALAGEETYGAGRYLEPEALEDGRVALDFNLAYNPYCAYNDAWSCPLTPRENRLSVPIRAGEKLFKHEQAAEDAF